MKRKSIMSIIVIAMVSVLMIGATMSWFTATAGPVTNTLTTGTVRISAVDGNKGKADGKNLDIKTNPDGTIELAGYHLNPGDTNNNLKLNITNIGTKRIYVRFKIDRAWYDTITNDKNPNDPNIGKIDENRPSQVPVLTPWGWSTKPLSTDNIEFNVSNSWIKEKDGYYCYSLPVYGKIENTGKGTDQITDPGISVTFHDQDHEIISEHFNDNDYQGKALKTTITVDAIQADHVDKPWGYDLNN